MLVGSQVHPHLEDGSVYRQNRPTIFDDIEILRVEIPVGAVGALDCRAVWRVWKEFVEERQISVGSADLYLGVVTVVKALH